jgi:hypothetical protein
LVGALPAVLVGGWLCRQAILSGYPLLPSKLGALPVDWRMPGEAVDAQNRIDRAWARVPGKAPDDVLASWDWLGPWLRTRFTKEPDVVAPLALLACVVPFMVGAGDRAGRERRLRPMLAVVVPSLLTLVLWFFAAPDPRFAFAPLWLVPIALAAWAVPAAPSGSLALWVGLTVAAACGLAILGVHELALFLPVAAAVWLLAGTGAQIVGSTRSQALIARVATASVLLAAVAISARDGGADHLVRRELHGRLGTAPVPLPQPTVERFVTSSGLELWRPVPAGVEDQCWHVLLCTPYPNSALRLRGNEIQDGFTVRGP